MKLCVAGAAGAFGSKHLEALAAIEGVEVVSVVGGAPDDIEGLAKENSFDLAASQVQLPPIASQSGDVVSNPTRRAGNG